MTAIQYGRYRFHPRNAPKSCRMLCVNRSNLWRTASISLFPSNFFVNFSEVYRVTDNICVNV